MAITEVYEAAARGAIWGFENTLNLANDLKQYEVIDTLVLLNSGVVMSSYTMMNLKKFNSLPKDLQKIILDTGVDWAENSLARALIEREKSIAQEWMEKRGIKVVKPKPDDLAYMKKTARDGALDLAKKQDARMGTPGRTEKVLQTLWNIVDQDERDLATKGYPWK
jgi:TRAP-type C4-dicarboxylate transport system substrate-binding protein